MAEVIFKSPCVGPGCTYYKATEPGETTTIPDAHLPELDPKCLIVIKDTSAPPPKPPVVPTLREQDEARQASEEAAEVIRLRQPDHLPPAAERASKHLAFLDPEAGPIMASKLPVDAAETWLYGGGQDEIDSFLTPDPEPTTDEAPPVVRRRATK